MTYEEYWDGDCVLTRYYREAEELRMQRENQRLHLQGAYIYEILLNVSSAFRAFSKTAPTPYRDHVIPFTAGEHKQEKQLEEKKKLEKSSAAMMQIMHNINRRRRNGT